MFWLYLEPEDNAVEFNDLMPRSKAENKSQGKGFLIFLPLLLQSYFLKKLLKKNGEAEIPFWLWDLLTRST